MRRYAGLVVALALVAGLAYAAEMGNPYVQAAGDEQMRVLASLPEVSMVAVDKGGIPTFVAGKLGNLGRGNEQGAALRFVRDVGRLYDAIGDEELAAPQTQTDDLGQVHVHLRQSFRGLPIEGADVVVHASAISGEVHALTGRLFPTAGLPRAARVGAETAITDAVIEAGISEGKVLDLPVLTYVVFDGKVFLAWTARVAYPDGDMMMVDRFYADAINSGLVTSRAIVKSALNRKVYNANHTNPDNPTLPGTLMFSEGGSSTDLDAMGAYNNTGATYNYYQTRFGRDSYNGSGAQLISSVHLGTNYVNAYWTGTQMAFGDGDGVDASSLAKDFDVVAHELTHAVTDSTANLNYESDSGALNEGMSDIFAAAGSAWKDGAVSANTWLIGEACWTPGTSGDALRYMANPTQDGYSKDYYPERAYATSCTPSSSNDYCGVHYNSGIANLAFYLLAQGGTHPRGKTTVNVPAITITKAEQIFYRALTYGYMTSTTNFQGARNATAQAATDLYSTTEVNAVQACWDAVGAPGGAVQVTTLTNGQAVTNLSGSTGAWAYYKLVVPASQTSLTIATSGGTGDLDLYVKRGAVPTSSSYDYRPYLSGNAETVTVSNPTAGDWYIGLYAYATYSGVTLQGTYTGGTTPTFTLALSPTTLSVAQGATGTATVTTAVSGGFNSAVALTASGVPSGATSSFSPTSIAAPGSGTSTLTLGGGTATAGTYTVTVTGTGGGVTKTATVSFTVTSSGGGVVVLTNGQTVSSLSGATGSWKYYKIAVPSGQSSLVIQTSGGTGDSDMYVKRGAQPTSSSYDYRPYLSGNAETVTVSNPTSGDWYIGLYAYAAYSGMSLQATYTGSTPSFTLAVSPTSLSVAKGASGTVTVTTAVSGGFSNAVALTISGVPTGATSSFNPTSIAAPGSGSSTLTLGGGTATAGTYTLTVTGTGGGLTRTATVSFTVTASGGTGTETEPNNTTATANNIATSGTQLTGYIGTSTDVDYFKMSLAAGKTLTVEMQPPSTKDYDVKLYNSSGTTLASGTNGTGAKETVTYKNTGTSAMTIYIKNYGYNSAYSATLSYTIKLTW
jgi:Zn-dependent metalloprotease